MLNKLTLNIILFNHLLPKISILILSLTSAFKCINFSYDIVNNQSGVITMQIKVKYSIKAEAQEEMSIVVYDEYEDLFGNRYDQRYQFEVTVVGY